MGPLLVRGRDSGPLATGIGPVSLSSSGMLIPRPMVAVDVGIYGGMVRPETGRVLSESVDRLRYRCAALPGRGTVLSGTGTVASESK